MDKDDWKVIYYPVGFVLFGLAFCWLLSTDSVYYGNINTANKIHEFEDRISQLEENVYGN